LQDEEINFALSANNDRVYYAAAFACDVLVSKYSTDVDIRLDEELEAKYSQLSEQFSRKATELRSMAKRVDGNALGLEAGGISKSEIDAVHDDSDREHSAFYRGQFANPSKELKDYDW